MEKKNHSGTAVTPKKGEGKLARYIEIVEETVFIVNTYE